MMLLYTIRIAGYMENYLFRNTAWYIN